MTTAVAPPRETRQFSSFIPLREADGVAVDKGARTAKVIIITEGLGNLKDRNFYTKDAVRSCVEVFDGQQFYIDHPSESEDHDRPERSIRDLAGYFYDTSFGTVRDLATGEPLGACFAKLRFDESASGTFAMEKVATAIEYQQRFPTSKDVYAGISINGGGLSHPGIIRGMNVNMVTEIQESFSADIVTKPARGGKFLAMVRESERAAEWRRERAQTSRERTAVRKGDAMKTDGTTAVTETKPAARESDKAVKDATVTKETEAKEPKKIAATIAKEADTTPGPKKEVAADTEKQVAREAEEAELDEAAETEAAESAETEAAESSETEAAESAETETETEAAEAFGKPAAGDDSGDEMGDDEMGMGDDNGSDELDDKNAMSPAMQYKCGSCGEVNQVMPPQGHKLVKLGDGMQMQSEESSDGSLAGRLRRQMEAKEQRFDKANQKVAAIMRENISLRAQLQATKRVAEAKALLKEAKIPTDILSARELAENFEPRQWAFEIKRASRALESERALFGGGAGPRTTTAPGSTQKREATDSAISAFRESYSPETPEDSE